MASRRQNLAETARKNRVELVDAGLTRRDLFKLGLLTGSGYLVAKVGLSSRAAGGGGAPSSPPTTPWVEELPIPPVASPVDVAALGAVPRREPNLAAGELGRPGPHQHWPLYDPARSDHYLIENRAASVSWHRELPPDECWCFDGAFPGTRIHARRNRTALIRFRNRLPSLAEHVGYGRPTTTTHLHGGHTGSESDGNPLDLTPPGSWRDHLYLNRCAGFADTRFGPDGDPRERVSTLWYHDHCLDFASQNIYRGNAGLYVVFDELDSGDENDPNPAAWRLPSGDFDVPLVLHDRAFDARGRGAFDLFDLDGVLGDALTVNGRIQPFMRVARRKYRFRAVNIGPSRFYDLSLSNGQAITQISRDGYALPRPLVARSVRLPVGGSADVVVDFGRLSSGQELYLVNCLEQRDGRGPTGTIVPAESGARVMKLIVDGHLDTNGDQSRIPETLVDLPPVDRAEVVAERTFVFDRRNGAWSVNGRPMDPNAIEARPRRGTAEIWNLANASSDRVLAARGHLEGHQTLSRGGRSLPPEEIAREDVAWLGPGEAVRTFRRFHDFIGRYPTHCQNLAHGDHALMFMWRVVA